MADIKRLVGNDGRLVRVSAGTGTTSLAAKSWGLITRKAPWLLSTGAIPVTGVSNAIGSSIVVPTLSIAPTAGMGVHFTVNGTTYSHVVAAGSTTTSITTAGVTTVVIPSGTPIYVGSMFVQAVGEFIYNNTTAALSLLGTDGDPSSGAEDLVAPITMTNMLDLSGWSLDMSADEVDVTVLGDTVKKYRKGKSDANGQMEFIFMKGETDLAGNLANYFMPISTVNTNGNVEYSARKTSALYVLGYLDETTVTGEYTMAMFFQVEFMSFSLPMNDSQAVKVSPKFRLSGAVNPTIYRLFN